MSSFYIVLSVLIVLQVASATKTSSVLSPRAVPPTRLRGHTENRTVAAAATEVAFKFTADRGATQAAITPERPAGIQTTTRPSVLATKGAAFLATKNTTLHEASEEEGSEEGQVILDNQEEEADSEDNPLPWTDAEEEDPEEGVQDDGDATGYASMMKQAKQELQGFDKATVSSMKEITELNRIRTAVVELEAEEKVQVEQEELEDMKKEGELEVQEVSFLQEEAGVPGATTTAISVWPAENMATTPAPAALQAAAPAAANTTAVNASAPPADIAVTLPPPPQAPAAAVPCIHVPAPAPAAPPFASAPATPCPQIDISATVDQIQNAARVSGQAAQAALDALGKAAGEPSALANMAYATANKGAGIWWKVITQEEKTSVDLLNAQGQLAAMHKAQSKAASDYEATMLRVRDFAPSIPAVNVIKLQKLRGLTRT